MMERYELQQLRDIPIEGVAERLGIQVTRHKCLCPFHDDHHASMSFSVKRNMFRCWACGECGGTIDLVMRRLGVGFKEACSFLANETPQSGYETLTLRNTTGRYENENEGEARFDARRYERCFERPWLSPAARRFLFEERRLDERVVRWCRLTSWRDKRGVDWLQTPYYDREGRLVGVQNRNLLNEAKGERLKAKDDLSPNDRVPRFRFPQGSLCGIYNLPILNWLKEGEALYITEGCSDCWAMLSAGHKAIAIPSATLLTRKDKEELLGLSSGLGLSFHMYPDRDLPGERLFLQLKEVLPNLVHHQLPSGCKDFGDYYVSKTPP